MRIERVQAWNLFHLVKFVWSDLFNTDHALPCGLTHDELIELLDICEYADTPKRHISSQRRERFRDMCVQLDFNQRSVKAHEMYLRKEMERKEAERREMERREEEEWRRLDELKREAMEAH